MPAPDWYDFRNPDYSRVFEVRSARLTKIRNTPGMLEGLKEHYKDNPVDFINDWGMTVDPRNAELKLPTVIPFILFPKQEEYIRWLHKRWTEREDGLAEKSRDMGVSWLCVGFAVWMWLFYPGAVIGFGSRKEEYVDQIGDPKCLFWKIREFIKLLPKEFRPREFSQRHAPHMRVLNPSNGAAIVGESGDNIGRGNRTSIYFKDESAFYERADAIDAALSQTSNCKIDVSTPNGNGNAFHRKRHSGKIKVFTFHWKDDPRKDQAWYEKQVETLDSVIVAQEIDIDYNASVSNAWINGADVLNAQSIGPMDVEPVGSWIIAVDAAHMGDDESIIHRRKGRLNLAQVILKKVRGPQLAGAVEEECRLLESVGEHIGAIIIELDGPGASCYDQLLLGPYRHRVVGVHTGAKLSDGRNYNLRALLWRRAREYVQSPPVCIARCSDFRSQISSMKFTYKNGLLLMQAKKEYKKDFGRSPDRADAFVLSFADTDIVEEYDDYEEAFGDNRSMATGY